MILSKIPNIALAKRIRAWMRERTGKKYERRFDIQQICDALNISPGAERQAVAAALYDFTKRGEINSYNSAKHNRRQYIYNPDWRHENKGEKNQKLFKAMYVSQSFAVADIQRLAGVNERNWLDRIVRRLKKNGFLQQIALRRCAKCSSVEIIYHITNRDRFKLELMK